MNHQLLKQNIVNIIEQKGLSMRKLERVAGLHTNFISNLLQDRSKNPSLDSIIRIATVLDVSIDKLVGRETNNKTYDLNIPKEIFLDIASYILKGIRDKQSNSLKLDNFFNAVYEVYKFSSKKDRLDKEFADWFIGSHL